jgi:hypothetical protein
MFPDSEGIISQCHLLICSYCGGVATASYDNGARMSRVRPGLKARHIIATSKHDQMNGYGLLRRHPDCRTHQQRIISCRLEASSASSAFHGSARAERSFRDLGAANRV